MRYQVKYHEWKSISKRNQRLIAKLQGRVDSVGEELLRQINSLDETLMEREELGQALTLFDSEYRRIYRLFKSLDRLLTLHLRSLLRFKPDFQ